MHAIRSLTVPFPKRLRSQPALLAGLLVLSACGGGGGGSTGGGAPTGTTTTATTSTTSTPGTTSTTTTPAPPSTVPPVIVGVAATDAPLLGATIRVVDGAGLPVMLADGLGGQTATAVTNNVDGAFRLTLAGAAPAMPLFIQAQGRATGGAPVALHSVVQANTAPAIAVANITPLTDAVVAEMLGADPRVVFQNATANVASIALLGNAAAQTAAMDHLKTVIAAALTDAKVTDKTLNWFKDGGFAANKTLVDGALEGLRVRVRTDAAGKDLLGISNKMTPPGTEEVTIDLAAAKAELGKTTGASLARAIISTLKATSAPGSSVSNVGTLDTLSAAVNRLIGLKSGAEAFGPLFAPFPMPSVSPAGIIPYLNDGRSKADISARFAAYAQQNYQLTKFEVTGCADDPAAAGKACTYLNVAANVVNSDGKVIDIYTDTATAVKAPVPNGGPWALAGNGRSTATAVYPVAYASFDASGRIETSAGAPVVNKAVQLVVKATKDDNSAALPSAIAQLPSGFTARLAQCGGPTLCLVGDVSAAPVYTGDLADTLLLAPAIGGVGAQDVVPGARYTMTLQGATPQTPSLYLAADLPPGPSPAIFPLPDGVLASTPLTPAAFLDGTLGWSNWALANRNMKIVLIRRIVVTGAGARTVADTAVPVDGATQVKLAALTDPAAATVTYTLLLGAEDTLGRRYFSRISLTR